MGMGRMMGMMKNMMGGKADELDLMAKSMDPDALGADMDALQKAEPNLGPNPFAGGGMPAGLPGLGGFGGGLPGLPTRGGTKKNRKPKNKKRR